MELFFTGLLAGILPAGYFYWREQRQKRQLRNLSKEIDEILHGNQRLELTHFKEGEIEILRDEIYKMTVRLREQSERLSEDKKELADSLADISHQIRTPLTALNLMNARLSGETLTELQKKQLLREMKQMLGKIDWLVTALLKMSKLEAGTIAFDMEEISVKKLIQDALEPFCIAAELREITMQCAGRDTIVFYGDYAWTLEAAQNILKNCLEYTPQGGTIQIFWEENPLYVQISVKDSGPGISKEDLPHLFERFYRGKNAGGESFGIGLALAQMIVTRENGIICAENCAEGGSLFRIKFMRAIV